MAGCTPACVRACVMLLLSMLGTLLNREADDLTSLGLALLLLLGANPMSVANLGLQLLFGSMLSMVLISPHIDLRLRKLWPGKGVKGLAAPGARLHHLEHHGLARRERLHGAARGGAVRLCLAHILRREPPDHVGDIARLHARG